MRQRTGAVLWILQPLCILAELLTVSQVRTPYSMLDSTISEAGAMSCGTITYAAGQLPVCSPLGWLLNAATVASGLAVLVGAVLMHSELPNPRIRSWVTVFAILSGLSLIGTGFVPVDLDLNLHIIVALPQFVTFPVLLILLFVSLRRPAGAAAMTSLAAAACCLAGTVAFIAQINNPVLGGLLERLALWPFFLALCPVGATLLHRFRKIATPSTSSATLSG